MPLSDLSSGNVGTPGYAAAVIEDTLLPDLPRPPRRYEVTVTVPRADDPDPALPPGGHAALNLAVAALSADGLLAAWTSSQTVVSMIVEADGRAGALAAGMAVAQALGGANGTATVTAGPVRERAAGIPVG